MTDTTFAHKLQRYHHWQCALPSSSIKWSRNRHEQSKGCQRARFTWLSSGFTSIQMYSKMLLFPAPNPFEFLCALEFSRCSGISRSDIFRSQVAVQDIQTCLPETCHTSDHSWTSLPNI